ncbi:dopaminechrome tautomerase [Leptinotarsa decemlineata]|uniref:dopaminechrome tautomerase n=1 Tax=Leptinotarsa decemlineata TaxID=7539 RepID=UPI003D305B6E
MMIVLLLGLCIGHALGLELLNQWNFLNYDFPPDYDISDFRPENTVFTGIEITDDRIFIATPRLRAGVPATFSSFPRNSHTGSSPILQAYPEWSFHAAGRGDFNCSGLISVYRAKIDSCNRLWVLDSGLDTSIDNFRTACPPKILIFDLRSNQIVRTIIIPEEVLRPVSALTNLILDESVQGKCDAAFIYISDTVAAGLIVYDGARDRSWRFSDPSMFPNPDYSKISIVGEQFSLMDGIIGLAHSPKLAVLFYQPLATDRIFSIPTATLTKGPPGEFEELPISVAGRKSSQGMPLAMNEDDNTLYFSPMTETSVASWNIVSNQQKILANDPVNLQFVPDIRWKEDGSIYILSSRFHKFYRRTVTPKEINLRILKVTPQRYIFENVNNFYY